MADKIKTGYVWHELYMWHDQGPLSSVASYLQPIRHWEGPETKRRLHNLLSASGLLDLLHMIKPRHATFKEIARVHDSAYLQRMKACSDDDSKGHHNLGHEANMAPGGYEIATLAAGGALEALKAVMEGIVRNAYVLVRPPGHHAERDRPMGFCFINNIAVVAAHAMQEYGLKRIAIVDWDVHHGNGTQHMFEGTEHVLFISLHQDGLYPHNSGHLHETGVGSGTAYTINVPLPPGSGSGAYRAAFDRVVVPALDAYAPELLLVSCGFDAAYLDPLSHMMLSSDDFRFMTQRVGEVADRHCQGRLLCLHEGGYSELYVPFCGLATVEQMSGISTGVVDACLTEVQSIGYQELQPHQGNVIRQAEVVVELLKERIAAAAEK